MVQIKEVEETVITRNIIREAAQDWINIADADVVVVGAGPAGLTASKYLAESGLKTVLFERRLSFGGGIGGGGILFHKLVIETPADEILKEMKCRLKPVDEGLYVADTAEIIVKLASAAIDEGTKVIFGVVVDDVIYRTNPIRVTGAVVQWVSVIMSGLHVDPLPVKAKAVIDCTGHDAEVLSVASRKIPELNIEVPGEGSMHVPLGERMVVEHTGEVCPGLYAAGMAVAALHHSPRMGPIFGGMLLSGRKVAQRVIEDFKASSKGQ
ncbi:MAG: thiazole biosynthesis protein [Nitrososphaeria archaeon]|nr:thiazole biosynthesis protein [Nitrososphaeria archaeon]NIN52434.1 thiazole biosynthesis protein [Nitrososphaeria archaeon]NIQ32935.1 thiazole biosynthesis protein [Nitrososphaeria archaeon]